MKIRFKFAKTGRLKYIGHLDLLDVWRRAFNASGLPVRYSMGYSPHMLLSFAAPLPLGLESLAEYADADFDDGMPTDGLAEKINASFPAGLKILDVLTLPQPYKRVAATVSAAKYLFVVPFEVTKPQLSGFLAQETIEILKKTKRSDEITNVRPDILSAAIEGENEISAILSCGSKRNLKPSLFIEAYGRFAGEDAPVCKIKITRGEIFAEDGVTPLSALPPSVPS